MARNSSISVHIIMILRIYINLVKSFWNRRTVIRPQSDMLKIEHRGSSCMFRRVIFYWNEMDLLPLSRLKDVEYSYCKNKCRCTWKHGFFSRLFMIISDLGTTCTNFFVINRFVKINKLRQLYTHLNGILLCVVCTITL